MPSLHVYWAVALIIITPWLGRLFCFRSLFTYTQSHIVLFRVPTGPGTLEREEMERGGWCFPFSSWFRGPSF